MGAQYTTIFEVSYFGAGGLLMPLLFLTIGVVAVMVMTTERTSTRTEGIFKKVFLLVWGTFWISASLFWLVSAVRETHKLTQALKQGRCAVVEGTVSVLREQPRSGHAPGDRIRIGDKEFVYSYFVSSPGYHTTVSHGGALVNGTSARLHYLGETIVRVEVKK
jgi:hypothetical protein